ncbi:MAG: hypothetical protein GY793_04035, partial [Proteobacteria bacterium]|nr:hypothetical protein [Pseudomonadota bacterium]
MLNRIALGVFTSFLLIQQASAVVVPGSVPPVRLKTVGLYADDSRGIAVPGHDQLILQDNRQLSSQAKKYSDDGVTFSDSSGNDITSGAAQAGGAANQGADITNEIARIANEADYRSQYGNGRTSGGVNVLEMTDISMQGFGGQPQMPMQGFAQGNQGFSGQPQMPM